MGTPTADKLRLYYGSKDAGSDGGAIASFSADAGCDVDALVDAGLTQAADYWNGAVGWFDGDTSTVALQEHFFHVEDFDAANDTIVPYKEFPTAPANGDTGKLAQGGLWRSDTELMGLTLDGDQPELAAVSGSNITGVTIDKASPYLGEGTLSLFFDQSEETLHIKMGSENYGVGLDVSGDVSNGIIFDEDDEGWIQVDVVNGSLPGGDQTDTFTTARPNGTCIPDYEGDETRNSIGGKTRYRLVVAKNTDGSDDMISLEVYADKPSGTATTVATGESLTTAEGSFDATDASSWPTRGFWIRNNTVNGGSGDCRFVKYRSGNTLYCAAVDWATLSFDQGDTEISAGDTITDASSGATAVVDQITLSSGSWAGSDAAGSMILKDVSGTFGNNNNIQVSGVTYAVADGDSALGLRGYTGTSWAATNAIEVMPDIDIGLDEPSGDSFEDIADVVTQPSGVTFTSPDSETDALSIGDLSAGDTYGVWIREWIMDPHRARADVTGDLLFTWS